MRIETTLSTWTDQHVLKNLFVYYRYDRMQYIQEGPGSMVNQHGVIDGEYSRDHWASVANIDVFWQKPGVVFPFLIRVDDYPVGFALIAKHPHCSAGCAQQMVDFMVIHKYQRKGIGRSAAQTVFGLFPGRWQLDYIDPAAGAFWRRVIGEHTGGKLEVAHEDKQLVSLRFMT